MACEFSSLMAALCLNGAKKILENGETLLKMMVDSMDISKPYSIQMEAFKLAQCLMVAILI